MWQILLKVFMVCSMLCGQICHSLITKFYAFADSNLVLLSPSKLLQHCLRLCGQALTNAPSNWVPPLHIAHSQNEWNYSAETEIGSQFQFWQGHKFHYFEIATSVFCFKISLSWHTGWLCIYCPFEQILGRCNIFILPKFKIG